MLMSIFASFSFFAAAFNFLMLFQTNTNGAANVSDGGVGLTPTTVGIPVLGYLLGAAIIVIGIYFIYRRAVLKKKDMLDK